MGVIVIIKHTQKVGLSRIELLTSRLSGVRSNHLSYRPIDFLRQQKITLKKNQDEFVA
jgi:hypothetical protein